VVFSVAKRTKQEINPKTDKITTYKGIRQFNIFIPRFTSVSLKGRNSPGFCGSQDRTAFSEASIPLTLFPLPIFASKNCFIVPTSLHDRQDPHHCPDVNPQISQTQLVLLFPFVLYTALSPDPTAPLTELPFFTPTYLFSFFKSSISLRLLGNPIWVFSRLIKFSPAKPSTSSSKLDSLSSDSLNSALLLAPLCVTVPSEIGSKTLQTRGAFLELSMGMGSFAEEWTARPDSLERKGEVVRWKWRERKIGLGFKRKRFLKV